MRRTPRLLAAFAALAVTAGCTTGDEGAPTPSEPGSDTGTVAAPGTADDGSEPTGPGDPTDVAATSTSVPAGERAYYLEPDQPIEVRVGDLLWRMDLADKVGQMTQAERSVVTPADVAAYRLGSVLSGGGSVPEPNTPAGWADMYDAYQAAATSTPLGIPIIYGVDAVHGHNNLAGATVFPHNIGLGATRNPDLVERIGRATAIEVAATGPTWTFSPCVCVARDDRWGRTYESFSELPEIVADMTSIVTGYQGQVLGAERASILATAKHFVGDGATSRGIDQGDTEIAEDELRAVHLAPFAAAVERGVGAVMVSFSSWNGIKLHAHEYLITGVLKGELGFDGIVVSDWAGIDQIDGRDGFTVDEVAAAINAGIDMVMVPYEYTTFVELLTEAVETGLVPIERIDDAVSRILAKKFELGLFERPYADRELADQIGSPAHRGLARQAVSESLVVLTNDGTLPLHDGLRVLVAGSNADDVGAQSGGWTLTWQGVTGPIPGGTSILAGIEEEIGDTGAVVHSPDASLAGPGFDVAIAVVGEQPYAEYEGDVGTTPTLTRDDADVLDRLRASGVPTIVVVVSGRPLDLDGADTWASAIVAAWLPGSEGDGVGDVLFGNVAPRGRLPMSWPGEGNTQPLNDGDGQIPLWPVGHGITQW